ncbi:MAG: hypothetical protein M0Z99_31525 [Betaproteobacteria bacterium]|nr:hypothetical protein [Betaproteobacteria bacterium]
MKPDDSGIDRISLRFTDAKLEAEHASEQALKSRRPTRVALLGAAGLTIFILTPLVYIEASHPVQEHMPRIVAMSLATIALCYALTHLQAFITRHQALTAGMALLMSLGMTYAVSHSQTREASGFFLITIHLFSIYGIFSLRFPAATACGWGSLLIYIAYLRGLGYLPEHAVTRHVGALSLANLWGMLICYQMDLAVRRAFLAVRRLATEHERSDQLLLNILPAPVAMELTSTGAAKPARHEAATLLFTDFSGFTQAASSMPAERMVAELNDIFSAFDDICRDCGIEKIKTIGDAYMAAAGVPTPAADHAQRAIEAGLRMASFIDRRNRTSAFKWGLRIGIHSGPVVAGVVGKHKYAFDVWGDTVNVASRMESSGVPGRVNISAYTFDLAGSQFDCEYRGKVDAKGKGPIDMYLVTAAK